MADYYAVLKRTLSGFGDAKPQLRQKLYERARTTIEVQLKSRTPKMSAKKIKDELKNLEEAITKVEAEYDGSAPDNDQALELDDIAPVVEAESKKPAKSKAKTKSAAVPETPTIPEIEPSGDDKDWELPPLDVPSIPLSADTSRYDDPVVDTKDSPFAPLGLQSDGPPIPISGSPPADDPDLKIPPAPGGEGDKKRGTLLLAGILAVAVIAIGSLIWTQRDTIGGIFASGESPPTPKPVKTIAIKPEPAKPEADVPKASEVKPEEPKLEQRLTDGGQEVAPAGSDPNQTALNAPESPTLGAPTTQEPVKPLGPVVSQTAILYEEGGAPEENTLDSGHVVWTVVQESPAEGEPEEPAIQARVEIPDRNVVLIMTLKRNSDKALPASHLIEFIFAVPDDFSGGAIEEINRFVFKDSEQGRGETLVAVPAPIAPGIFLVALNNAPTAQEKNINLMKTKSWIDIPLQYRTGRRALITMEKGIPGERVFEEVFAAWDKK